MLICDLSYPHLHIKLWITRFIHIFIHFSTNLKLFKKRFKITKREKKKGSAVMNRNELQKNWTSVKEKIRDEYGITDVSYNTWIKDLTFQSVSGDQITIAIPSDNAMMLSYLNNRYKDRKSTRLNTSHEH